MMHACVVLKASVAKVLKMVNGSQVVGNVVKEPGVRFGESAIT